MITLNYNVVIIGGGIGGLISAYNIKNNNPDLSVCIIDKGKELENRRCPASKTVQCAHCETCAKTCGIAGAGAYSDGKFNIGTAYGGSLSEYVGDEDALSAIMKADSILTTFVEGRLPTVFYSNDDLKIKCLQNNLQLLDMNVRHYGTDGNKIVMGNLVEYLRSVGVTFFTETEVKDVWKTEGINKGKWYINDIDLYCDNVIIATGRGGSAFVSKFCLCNDIPVSSNTVDIGVRVEMQDIIWKEFSDKIYEPKILYKTRRGERKCRMFCFNQGGFVSAENNNGIVTANGHAFANPNQKTDNCNFAILASTNFTEPFNQPTEYAEYISKLANIIGDGNVLVQRLGDLMNERRSTASRIAQNSVIPTMKATAGDISLVLPERILNAIKETLIALDKVAPGTANPDVLLYGCESKYYSVRPKFLNDSFEVTDGVFIIGDGSGVARGLSQSAAMGIIASDKILERVNGEY